MLETDLLLTCFRESAALKVNGNSVSLPTGESSWAAIDTGTTGVGLPQSILTEIFNNVQGSQQRADGYYQFRKSFRTINHLRTSVNIRSFVAVPYN